MILPAGPVLVALGAWALVVAALALPAALAARFGRGPGPGA